LANKLDCKSYCSLSPRRRLLLKNLTVKWELVSLYGVRSRKVHPSPMMKWLNYPLSFGRNPSHALARIL
jgi:hypothetical protein